jgi:hypothetical protein
LVSAREAGRRHGESADYCLTADGVDFVEEHALARDLLTRLLEAGGSCVAFAEAGEESPVFAPLQSQINVSLQ